MQRNGRDTQTAAWEVAAELRASWGCVAQHGPRRENSSLGKRKGPAGKSRSIHAAHLGFSTTINNDIGI